jgi:hypothetical protein
MRRRTLLVFVVLAGALVLGGCVASVAVLCAPVADADRRAHVRANLRLVDSISPYPKATRLRIRTEPFASPEPCGGSYVSSYDTTVTYRAARSTWRSVIRYYRDALRSAGWDRASVATGGECFRNGDASLCVDARAPWDGVFEAHVDSEGWAPSDFPGL